MKVSKLKRNPGNPRQIKGDKLEKLKASIGGFQKMMDLRPMIVDENNTVLGGNMRLAAIKALGLKEIPDEWVKRVDDLTEDEKAQFIITDNSSFGEYDWDAIANEWSDYPLADWGLDVPCLDLAGDPGEPVDAEPQMDKAAELNKKWKVASGDLWQIGEHRLLCGDSTKREDVERVMNGHRASITFTSPPYNLGTNVSLSTRGKKDNAYGDYQDDKTDDEWLSLMSSFFLHANAVSAFQFINVQMLSGNKIALLEFMSAFKHKFADVAVWTKSNPQPAMAEGVMSSAFEFILIYSQSDNPTRQIPGDFRGSVSNVYSGTVNSENVIPGEHSATFPLTLCVDFLKVHATESVYDPFAGSGTTLVACQNLHRKCYAIEISEAYCAVILERMQTAFPELEIKRVNEETATSATA